VTSSFDCWSVSWSIAPAIQLHTVGTSAWWIIVTVLKRDFYSFVLCVPMQLYPLFIYCCAVFFKIFLSNFSLLAKSQHWKSSIRTVVVFSTCLNSQHRLVPSQKWQSAKMVAPIWHALHDMTCVNPLGDFTFWISPWLSLLAETKH